MNFKKLIARLLKPLSSNKNTVFFFSYLHRLSLFGLFGDEWDFLRNGELAVIKMIAAKKTGSVVIFDVGANEGIYCENVIKEFSHQQVNLVVHGFEPASDTYKRYSDRFKKVSGVIKNNVGLSDTKQMLRLYKSAVSSGFATLYQDNKFDFNTSEEVAFITLDEYAKANEIDVIHFLKMDVEGHELAVLKGATQALEKRMIKVIQFEFGAGNISSRTYFKDFYDLLSDNYQLFRIVKNGLIPIYKYDYSIEVFGRVTNYVAFLKTFQS